MKIGLTGNYFSGQDEVAILFRDKNVPVFDADVVLKYFINFSPKHMEKISNKFGDDYYNYGLLRLNLFKTTSQWNKLLDLLEFDLIESYEKFRVKHINSPYTIFKFTYLFERSLDTHLDKVITCYRPQRYRKYDLKNFSYMDELTIQTIFLNEMKELYKNSKSDFIIHNYNITGDKYSDIVTGLEKRIDQINKYLLRTNLSKSYEYFDDFPY